MQIKREQFNKGQSRETDLREDTVFQTNVAHNYKL